MFISHLVLNQLNSVQRPYRIPIPDWFALPFVIPPVVGILVVFAIANWSTYVFIICVFILGILCHYLLHMSKMNNWFTFEVSNMNRIHNPSYENVNDVDCFDNESWVSSSSGII